MRRWVLAALTATLLVGPAAGAGIWSYSWTSDAKLVDEGRTYTIYVHPKEPLLLLQPRMGNILTGEVSEWPLSYWRHAAETFVQPLGSGISDVRATTRAGATWEARFVCPDDVDLRAIVKAQRPALQRGEQLHR